MLWRFVFCCLCISLSSCERPAPPFKGKSEAAKRKRNTLDKPRTDTGDDIWVAACRNETKLYKKEGWTVGSRLVDPVCTASLKKQGKEMARCYVVATSVAEIEQCQRKQGEQATLSKRQRDQFNSFLKRPAPSGAGTGSSGSGRRKVEAASWSGTGPPSDRRSKGLAGDGVDFARDSAAVLREGWRIQDDPVGAAERLVNDEEYGRELDRKARRMQDSSKRLLEHFK